METSERLYRSRTNKVIGGVAGGLADYFNIDVVLARVVFVLLAMFGGGGVLIYIVMWIVIPAQTTYLNTGNQQNSNNQNADDYVHYDESDKKFTTRKPAKNSNTGLIAGIILIFMGLIFLVDRLMPWYNITDFWPLILVIVGVLIIKPNIFKPTKKQSDEI